MDQPICPACKAENDENAVYCDQCGQHLVPPEAAEEVGVEGACPACGGVVQDRGAGVGVCRSCGLELHAAEGEAPKVDAGADAAERLTAAILRRTAAGMPLEKAAAEACRELLGARADEPPATDAAEAGKLHPCPLCGAECSEEAPRCVGCGLWFHGFRTPQACPRCDRMVAGDKCECGAIMTLPKLLQYVEPSVKFVCSRCKGPYSKFQAKCPDCGGGLISADRIKAFAAAGE